MDSKVIDEIIKIGKEGKCILFLGAMASAAAPAGSPYNYGWGQAPPSGTKLSEELAGRCGYPDEDKTNLQRVALYHEFRKGGTRAGLIKDIRDLVDKSEFEPSPALDMLAALPFRIVITTNYDRLFEQALWRAKTLSGENKKPTIRIYNPDGKPEPVVLDPKEREPILFKLHGSVDRPESIVVTEEDYMKFIHKMSLKGGQHPIHSNIQARMGSWPMLFIGYSLKDYNLRLLLRALAWNIDRAQITHSYSVDPTPDHVVALVLQSGAETQKIIFIEEDLWDVVPVLYRACIGREYDVKSP